MLKKAEEVWLISAQENIMKEIKPETMKRLGVIKEDGVLVVGARLETWGKLYVRRKESLHNLNQFVIKISATSSPTAQHTFYPESMHFHLFTKRK